MPNSKPSAPGASNGHHTDADPDWVPQPDPAFYDPLEADPDDATRLRRAKWLRAFHRGMESAATGCWCPDAPLHLHERGCHIEALAKMARQWTCRAGGGGYFLPGGIALECDCPTCRIEMAISTIGNRIVNEIRNLELDVGSGNMNMNIREAEVEEPEDAVVNELDLKERFRRLIRAMERHGLEQGEDGNWNCAHPDHEDEHPSMSIIKDNTTGKISLHCHGCAPGRDEPELRTEWVSEVLKALGLQWPVLFPKKPLSDDHEPPF